MASNRSLESFVPVRIVSARHLQQQPLQRIQTAQGMPGNGIRQTRAQHDELMLTLALRRADGAAHGVVQPPELALGAAIHIPHAGDNGVRLIVEIQAVGNELFQFNVRRAFKRPSARRPAAAFAPVAAWCPGCPVSTIPWWPAGAVSASISRWALAGRAVPTRPRGAALPAVAAREAGPVSAAPAWPAPFSPARLRAQFDSLTAAV